MLSGGISDTLAYEVSQQEKINCMFLGQQKYSENLAYLKSCNICISPTLLESFGMAILEATLSGIPVVAFNVGGNKEIINDGKNGYLVDYLDINDLCSKAKLLIEKPFDKKSVIESTKVLYSLDEIEKNISSVINSCKDT